MNKLYNMFNKIFSRRKQYVHSPRNKVSYNFKNMIKKLVSKYKKKK